MNEFDDLNFDKYEKFLENYKHTPDDDVWDKIRTGLPKTKPVGKASFGRGIGVGSWKVAAVGLFALLMSVGFLYFNENNNESFAIVNGSNKQSGVNEKKESSITLESQLTTNNDDLPNSALADILLNNNKSEYFKEVSKDVIYEKANIEQKSNFSNDVNNNHHTSKIASIFNEEKNTKKSDNEITSVLFEKEQGNALIIQDKNESVKLLEYKQDYLESILQEPKIEAKKHLPERVMQNLKGLNITVYGEYGLQDWKDTERNSERLFWDSKLHTNSNFAAGVLIGKNISKNISIQTGLEFLEINHSFKTYGNLIAAEEEDVYFLKLDTYLHQYNLKASGKELISTPVSDLYVNTNHRFRFLSIPIWTRYSIDIGPKLDLGLSTGFAAVFLTQNRLQLIDYTTREIQLSNFEMENSSGINKLSFSMSFAIDLEYRISRRTKLLMQTSYKESIRANNVSNNIKLKGLNFRTGLKFLL